MYQVSLKSKYLNPFLSNWLFYLNSLDQSISNRRSVWLVFHYYKCIMFYRNFSVASDLGLHGLLMSILWVARYKWVNFNRIYKDSGKSKLLNEQRIRPLCITLHDKTCLRNMLSLRMRNQRCDHSECYLRYADHNLRRIDTRCFCHFITKTCLYNVDRKTGVYTGIHYFTYFCSKT